MAYSTYIIRSESNRRFYTGSCEHLAKRLKEHNLGKTKSTKGGVPWVVVHEEAFATRQEAYRREKQIKSYKGGNAFKKLLG